MRAWQNLFYVSAIKFLVLSANELLIKVAQKHLFTCKITYIVKVK